jgi:Outer membrane protein beta-barrel domain
MKKQLLFSLILCTFCASLSAQALRFGLKAGAGVSNLRFSGLNPDNTDEAYVAEIVYERKAAFRPTYLLGGVMEYDLTKDWLLSTGLNLTTKFSKIENSPEKGYSSDFRLRLTYLQVPLNIHYRRAKFFIGAGGYLGICPLGKWNFKRTFEAPNYDPMVIDEGEAITFGNDPEYHNLKRFDFGVRGELGYGFKTMRLSLAYDHGLANNLPTLYNIRMEKMRHQAIYATVTYYWLAKG